MTWVRDLPSGLLRVLPVVMVAALWEVAPRVGWVSPEMLPSLTAVFAEWVKYIASGELIVHVGSSMLNLVVGLGLGIIVGGVIGLLMAWYSLVNATVGPLIQMTYPIPRTALIPVMIIWFGLGAASKIAAIFSGCLLPVVLGAYNGARGVDPMLIWSARGLGATRQQALWEIAVPAAIPDILASIRTALAIGFVLMVTSEFLVAQRGLGFLISFLGDAGAYSAMFAVVLTVAGMGFVADRLYLMLMRRLLQWRE